MRIVIAAVGKARRDPAGRLFDHYANRLSWPMTLKEVDVRKALPSSLLKEKEADLLLAAVPSDAVVVALDEHGTTFSSLEFSERMRTWRDEGTGTVAFLIGGSAGHGLPVLDRANLTMSLGRMTWPHLLVRGMLSEQLYRAQQILAGHPYHRD